MAIDARLRINHQHLAGVSKRFDGAGFSTSGVLAVLAGFSHNVGHDVILSLIQSWGLDEIVELHSVDEIPVEASDKFLFIFPAVPKYHGAAINVTTAERRWRL